MTYVKALSKIDNVTEKFGQQPQETKVRETQGIIKKPFDLELPEIDAPNLQFQSEYLYLKAIEERIQETKDTDFANEGTGPSTVETATGPKRSPKYSARQGYPIEETKIEAIIAEEARLRNIDPNVAIRIYQHEGRGSYQSQVPRQGKGSDNGLEASYGPFQLYIGGGLGNQYQKLTGRDLKVDNTEDGIRKQTRFALDMAAEQGWGAWYGRKPAGVGVRDGLEGAKAVGNWRDE